MWPVRRFTQFMQWRVMGRMSTWTGLGRIGWSLRATVDWLTEKLGRRLRVDTYGGEVDVTFLRLEETEMETDGRNVRALRDAIRRQPWFSRKKTYAVYHRGPTDNAGGINTGAFATVFFDSRGLDRPYYFVTRRAWVPWRT